MKSDIGFYRRVGEYPDHWVIMLNNDLCIFNSTITSNVLLYLSRPNMRPYKRVL